MASYGSGGVDHMHSDNQINWSNKYTSVGGALDACLLCKKGVGFGEKIL